MRGVVRMARIAPVLLVCLLVALTTEPAYLADTSRYINEILNHRAHTLPASADPFWDFGHVAWRPLVNTAFDLAGPTVERLRGGDERQAVAWIMIAIAALSTLCAILLLWSFLERHTSAWAAWVGASACLCTNAVLDYSRSGAPYLPALAWLVLSLWLVERAHARPARAILLATFAGLSLFASIAFWFPFLLAAPVAALYALYGSPKPPLRLRVQIAAVLVAVCVVLLGASYVAAARARQIHSFAELKSWINASRNDVAQTDKIKRAVSGVPRSFLDLGDDTLLLKRYVFRDPYNRVGIGQVLLAPGTIKLLLFYLYAGAVVVVLWKSPGGRRTLVLLAAAAAPVVGFAVFLFEPGATERYLPAYPFVFLAAACALTGEGRHSAAVRPMMAFFLLAVLCAGNIYAKSPWRTSGAYQAFLERKDSLEAQAQPGSMVAVINFWDPLYRVPPLRLLDSRAQPRNLWVYDVIETASARVFRWRQELAENALERWSRGEQVWLSDRLLADRPLPEWKWIEGDTGRVKWTELRDFFRSLDVTERAGGNDGFALLAPDTRNLERLGELATTSK